MEISKAITFFMTSLYHAQLSQHTIKAYARDLEQWNDAMHKSELDTLSFEDFQDYFMTLQNHELKAASLKRKRVVVHRFLKFCYQKKLCKDKIYEYIDPIKTKKNTVPKEVLKKEELNKIFEFIVEEQTKARRYLDSEHKQYLYYCTLRNELLISILLYTGCRANELVTIKKQDLDLANRTITILAKGHKYNMIPIHDELYYVIQKYEESLKDLIGTPIIESVDQSEYLFPSKLNSQTHLSTRTLQDYMSKLSEVIGRHIHAHLFRHTFASYCIAANMDISTISSLISHSNPSITLSIYTHEIQATQKQQELKKLTFDIK